MCFPSEFNLCYIKPKYFPLRLFQHSINSLVSWNKCWTIFQISFRWWRICRVSQKAQWTFNLFANINVNGNEIKFGVKYDLNVWWRRELWKEKAKNRTNKRDVVKNNSNINIKDMNSTRSHINYKLKVNHVLLFDCHLLVHKWMNQWWWQHMHERRKYCMRFEIYCSKNNVHIFEATIKTTVDIGLWLNETKNEKKKTNHLHKQTHTIRTTTTNCPRDKFHCDICDSCVALFFLHILMVE